MLTKAKFLTKLTTALTTLGHDPWEWSKGRWGYSTNCRICGAHASCCVSDNRIREFPEDTCLERQASVTQTLAEWKAKELNK